MSHVLLIGFMGSGKSTVGRIVAERLGMPFIDLDEVVERREGREIKTVFATDGEEAFRDLERDALESLVESPPSVAACGGGVVIRDENRATLKRLGTVVYLQVDAGEALARIGGDDTRPLLSGPAGAVTATQLLGARKSLYSAVADVRVDTAGRSPQEVAEHVLAALEAREAS